MTALDECIKRSPIGLTNDDFWRIHHFRVREAQANMASHRRYISEHETLPDGTNRLVMKRCEFMLKVIDGLPADHPIDWTILCEAAWIAIPNLARA
jgi:hypothetical protein